MKKTLKLYLENCHDSNLHVAIMVDGVDDFYKSLEKALSFMKIPMDWDFVDVDYSPFNVKSVQNGTKEDTQKEL